MNIDPSRPSPGGRRRLTWLVGLAFIALVAIAEYLSLPSLVSSGRRPNAHIHCKSSLRQFGLALDLYRSDYGRHKLYPPGGGATLLNQLFTLGNKPILKDQFGLVICEVKQTPPPRTTPITESDTDYLLKAGGSPTESAILASFAADEPIAMDRPHNHDKDGVEVDANVLFMDTHVETVTDPKEIARYRSRVLTPGSTK